MLKFIFLLLMCQTSIYTLDLVKINGSSVSFNTFRSKKILVVNIATGSGLVGQLAELQQLQQLYQDSLVVIAFPSGSFGNESRSNADIKQFCESQYGTTFILAAKAATIGAEIQPVYNWLAQKSENGMMDGMVGGDFQKFLIERDGTLIGVFAPSINPMDSIIQNAITGN